MSVLFDQERLESKVAEFVELELKASEDEIVSGILKDADGRLFSFGASESSNALMWLDGEEAPIDSSDPVWKSAQRFMNESSDQVVEPEPDSDILAVGSVADEMNVPENRGSLVRHDEYLNRTAATFKTARTRWLGIIHSTGYEAFYSLNPNTVYGTLASEGQATAQKNNPMEMERDCRLLREVWKMGMPHVAIVFGQSLSFLQSYASVLSCPDFVVFCSTEENLRALGVTDIIDKDWQEGQRGVVLNDIILQRVGSKRRGGRPRKKAEPKQAQEQPQEQPPSKPEPQPESAPEPVRQPVVAAGSPVVPGLQDRPAGNILGALGGSEQKPQEAITRLGRGGDLPDDVEPFEYTAGQSEIDPAKLARMAQEDMAGKVPDDYDIETARAALGQPSSDYPELPSWSKGSRVIESDGGVEGIVVAYDDVSKQAFVDFNDSPKGQIDAIPVDELKLLES